MRAVLDLGTNSVRLLLAQVSKNKVQPLMQETRVTRLGQGVDASGHLTEAGVERTLDALVELVTLIPANTTTSVLATSAVRDASNRGELARLVRERTGLDLKVLSGAQEAQLSFAGAVLSLQNLDLPEPLCVVDIGGGSTEIYTGLANGRLLGGGSAQLGAVRMLERFISTHPLIALEQFEMEQEIESLLKPLVRENLDYGPKTLVAVGGTATSLAAINLGLTKFDYEKVTGYQFSAAELEDLYANLGRLSLKERSRIPSLQAGREDVIVCGASILVRTVKLMGFSKLITSIGDLLYGSLVLAVDEG